MSLNFWWQQWRYLKGSDYNKKRRWQRLCIVIERVQNSLSDDVVTSSLHYIYIAWKLAVVSCNWLVYDCERLTRLTAWLRWWLRESHFLSTCWRFVPVVWVPCINYLTYSHYIVCWNIGSQTLLCRSSHLVLYIQFFCVERMNLEIQAWL